MYPRASVVFGAEERRDRREWEEKGARGTPRVQRVAKLFMLGLGLRLGVVKTARRKKERKKGRIGKDI